jgi:hypothetical protein
LLVDDVHGPAQQVGKLSVNSREVGHGGDDTTA